MEKTRIISKPSKKWSMGKHLRALKKLKRSDSNAVKLMDCEKKNEYLQYFQSKGVVINKVGFAKFFLKNGLSYEGLLSTEPLLPNETIIRVPKDLLLSARDALTSSDFQSFLQENPGKLLLDGEIDEDSLLVLFILHEYEKGEKSRFFHLISNLPREQDVLCIWPPEDIELFEDEQLLKKSVKRLSGFKENYELLKSLIKKYPSIVSPETFTYESYCWISCMLGNRSFGKNVFSYTTMIPLAENLNHECLDGYIYWEDKYEQKEEIREGAVLKEESEKTTSDKSSEEWLSEDENDFCNYNNNEEFKDEVSEGGQEKEDVVKVWLESNLCFQELSSLIFSYKLLSFMKEQEKKIVDNEEILKGCKEFKNSLESELIKKYFLFDDYWHYVKRFQKSASSSSEKSELKEESKVNLFKKEFEEEKFDCLEFRVGENEKYEKNSQVYYCYGRRSNNILAECYGIAIEHNKYDNVFLRFDYKSKLNPNGLFYSLLNGNKIEKNKVFKFKYTKFNQEIMIFVKLLLWRGEKEKIEALFKPCDWNLEIAAVDLIIEFLDSSYHSKFTMKQNEEILYDKSTGYHHYFASVFRLEKQRIVKFHRTLFEVYKEILKRVKTGGSLSECLGRVDFIENEEEYQRNRYILHDYLVKS